MIGESILAILMGAVAGYLVYRFMVIHSRRKRNKNMVKKINNEDKIFLNEGKEISIVQEEDKEEEIDPVMADFEENMEKPGEDGKENDN